MCFRGRPDRPQSHPCCFIFSTANPAGESHLGCKSLISILVAVEEVNDAIKQYRAQQQRLRERSVALEQSRRAVQLATERYERGLIDFLNVLDAQRQEFEIEDQNAVAREAVVVQYIALYKELGGGWALYDELPPAVVATVRRLSNDWH
jgi:Outer membrane efflux protein